MNSTQKTFKLHFLLVPFFLAFLAAPALSQEKATNGFIESFSVVPGYSLDVTKDETAKEQPTYLIKTTSGAQPTCSIIVHFHATAAKTFANPTTANPCGFTVQIWPIRKIIYIYQSIKDNKEIIAWVRYEF